jgi:hypothetical protein
MHLIVILPSLLGLSSSHFPRVIPAKILYVFLVPHPSYMLNPEDGGSMVLLNIGLHHHENL